MWPLPGRCSACASPAVAFPSGRWTHLGGVVCVARSVWRHPDDGPAAVFKADPAPPACEVAPIDLDTIGAPR